MLPILKEIISNQTTLKAQQTEILIQQQVQEHQIQSLAATNHYPSDDMDFHNDINTKDLDMTMSPTNTSSASSKHKRDAPSSSQYSEDAEND